MLTLVDFSACSTISAVSGLRTRNAFRTSPKIHSSKFLQANITTVRLLLLAVDEQHFRRLYLGHTSCHVMHYMAGIHSDAAVN